MVNDVCSELLDQRKQAKLQLLQNPIKTNGENLHNLRRETSKTFRREYLTEKYELETNRKQKCQPCIEV
jgi:hypothetical protein